MIYTDLAEYTRVAASKLAPGPVAVLFMEDLSETNSTIRHHLKLGFANVIVLGVDGLVISPELVGKIGRVIYDPLADAETARIDCGVDLIAQPTDGQYDAVILAVAHDAFHTLGAARLRAFGKPGALIYDLKGLMPPELSDLRL